MSKPNLKRLVVLNVDVYIAQAERKIETIFNADWWVVEGLPNSPILVDFDAIDGLTETDPLDAGIDVQKVRFSRIPHFLKRWNPGDGFYHS